MEIKYMKFQDGYDKETAQVLVLATSNSAKVDELNQLLKGTDFMVRSLKEIAGDCEIEESGDTLAENAEIKARYVWEKTGFPSLADDTGLEVDALAGRPGVHSARFAGPETNSEKNRIKLLDAMRHLTVLSDRSAQFRTVLCYRDGNGIKQFDGVCKGHILQNERGSGGFGYDPLFQPDGYEQSFAEMDPEEKNRISHRGKALQKFMNHFSKRK